uniref:VQ domain-containing protein n=1 Tax=Kalanchoe fedtschenkoi TaxID=63787 RepID=A0A7N0U7M9_KALFE
MNEEPYINGVPVWAQMYEDSLTNHENLSAASGALGQLQVYSNSSDNHHHNSWGAAISDDPAPNFPDEGLISISSADRLSLSDDHNHTVRHSSSADPKAAGKRRSRAFSRKASPSTTRILNANTDNFKDLVQQYTGCPTLPFGSLTGGSSGASLKGPVMLCFDQETHDHQASIDYYDRIEQRVEQHHFFLGGYGNSTAGSGDYHSSGGTRYLQPHGGQNNEVVKSIRNVGNTGW